MIFNVNIFERRDVVTASKLKNMPAPTAMNVENTYGRNIFTTQINLWQHRSSSTIKGQYLK